MNNKYKIILSLIACLPTIINLAYSINSTNQILEVAQGQLNSLNELSSDDSVFDACPDIITNTEFKIINLKMQRVFPIPFAVVQTILILYCFLGSVYSRNSEVNKT